MKKTVLLMTLVLADFMTVSYAKEKLTENDVLAAGDDATKNISILAIGNSFSVDALQYLYNILQDAGYEKIVLGNLYIGGCSLQTHAGHFSGNATAYTYYKNTTGSWTSTASTAPLTALDERSWDYISMQQASGSSGRPDTYEPYIETLLEIVKTHCPAAKLVWHMTWAYQGNSTHSSFPYYNSDQMTMYNAIVSTVQSKILSRDDFSFVIPTGTAVQNLRTSYMGDNLTRDGYHMSYDKGRFVTALTWARKITGCDLDAISWTPSAYSYSETDLAAIKEAASQAVAHPYVVTPSSYSQGPSAESLKAILTARGYDPDDLIASFGIFVPAGQ